ncbi:hypothetical protein [Actinoplanes sp. ATCC 53533]|uniref:hypothetical protein n=1 Tax=Actinoplanes sp. ATCC 53533 TaxID=1288362 RepID=UPI00131560F9|nr:hypothetical protein [Actinoplanes sp. ATCC 53533]
MPRPSSTGISDTTISSSSPASRYCRVRVGVATATILSPAAAFAAARAASASSWNVVVESARGQPGGTEWLTTKTGAPHGCVPPQPPARSKTRRPARSAPTAPVNAGRRCSALAAETRAVMSAFQLGISTSPLPYQPNSSSTPSPRSATKPSSDIDMSATTLAMTIISPPSRWCHVTAS